MTHKRTLLFLLLAFVALALAWNVVVPPYENLDEIEHAEVIRYVVSQDACRFTALRKRPALRSARRPLSRRFITCLGRWGCVGCGCPPIRQRRSRCRARW